MYIVQMYIASSNNKGGFVKRHFLDLFLYICIILIILKPFLSHKKAKQRETPTAPSFIDCLFNWDQHINTT